MLSPALDNFFDCLRGMDLKDGTAGEIEPETPLERAT